MRDFIVPVIVGIFFSGLLIGVFLIPNLVLDSDHDKQKAVVKPLGYTIVKTDIEKDSFIAMEVTRVDEGYDDTWMFRTSNDTSLREVILHDTRLNVGDLVVFEKITQIKDCNIGVQLQVPDFESIWFENIMTKNFSKNQLPEYYTERYDIKTDFTTCEKPVITKWNSVYRNGELIEKMQLERTGYEI